MDELQQHQEIVKARLAGQNLSVLEMRREARLRHEQLLNPDYAADREVVLAEIQVLDGMIASHAPPPVAPTELLAQLRESNPHAASALENTLQRQQLEQAVHEARAFVEAHPSSDRAVERLNEALKALQDQPPAQFVQDQLQAKDLRAQAETLQSRLQLAATTDEEASAIEAETEDLFKQARQLESGQPIIELATAPGQPEPHPDHVAIAEQLVEDAMRSAS